MKYTLHTDTALTTPGLAIEVKLFFALIDAGAYTEVITFSLTPDEDGNVSIDWRRIIDSKLSFEIPTTINTIETCYKQTGKIYIKYREVTVALPDPEFATDADNVFWILKGGLPSHRWHRSKFFTDFSYAQRYFLTWKQSNFKIGINQHSWLTYRHLTDDVLANARVIIELTYTDSTVDQTTVLIPPGAEWKKYGVYRIPAGIINLALDGVNPAKKIVRIRVMPFNNVTALTNNFTLTADYRTFYNTVTMHYFNSLGGFDSQRILGDITPSLQRTFDMAESNAENDGESSILPAMQFTQQVEEQMMFRGNAGIFEDEDEQDVLRDLLVSKEVYEYKFEQWYRLNIQNQATELGARSQDILDLAIEWSYGYINESYAPDKLNLLG